MEVPDGRALSVGASAVGATRIPNLPRAARGPRSAVCALRSLLVVFALALGAVGGCADPGGQPLPDIGGDTASSTDVPDTTSDTTPALPQCGDGQVDPASEECDPAAQPSYACSVFGAGLGEAVCTSTCRLDLSGCSEPPATCGNGVRDPGEVCDGSDLGGHSCASQGLVGGTLGCAANCQLDTRACTGTAPVCGDGVRQGNEACDGTDLGGATCLSVGDFIGGTLGCSASCALDTSGCEALCGNGVLDPGELCDDGNRIDDLTCSADCRATCGVGTGECNGNESRYCLRGEVVTEYCDPLVGSTCNASTGRCTGACTTQALGRSYVGCDYYPTVTANIVDSKWSFAVAVSNTSTEPATVTVTRGDAVVATQQVAGRSVAVMTLPWVHELKGPSSLAVVPFPASIQLADGAYRLRSTRPVTVYQFNPLEYTNGLNCADQSNCTYTNDASLLLPTHVWGREYRVASRAHFYDSSGFVAVTASEDNTAVTVTAAPGAAGSFRSGVDGISSSGAGSVVMQAGDVMQIVTDVGGDPTGYLVTSDKPVQVIGGHQCVYVPESTPACDHLEESMFPIETLATQYLVTAPMEPGGSGSKGQVVRIIATADNTTLTYDPPQPDAPTAIAQAGGWFELAPRATDFVVAASSPVLIARYMLGQSSGASSGDPAMATAVNTAQFRTDYLFHAPTNYEENWVNITSPLSATDGVRLDGQPVSGWTPIGGSSFAVTRQRLSNAGDGNHSVTSSSPVGITVYGYGQYTSYWYPGGLNLDIIN